MVLSKSNAITRFLRKRRLGRIAKTVRNGHVPKNVDFETICEALRITRPRGAVELFGMLFAKVFDSDGNLKQDAGLVGVREVTTEFVNHLVDAMADSAVAADFHLYNAHEMGDGSTAETETETALVNPIDGRNIGSQTHGATSNIYKSVATITAGSAYTVIEHAIFNQTSTSGDKLLDRTQFLASEFTVATSDEVEWTYQLTCTEGN